MLSNDPNTSTSKTCSFDQIKKSFVRKYFEGANLMNEIEVEFLFSFALILLCIEIVVRLFADSLNSFEAVELFYMLVVSSYV